MTDDFGRPERRQCCPTCGAIGYVVKRYWLAKANEEDVAPEFRGPHRVVMVCTVVGSADIFEVCREAIELADSLKKGVVFDFSGHQMFIWPGADANQRARDWWMAMYGETPEQTRSRR